MAWEEVYSATVEVDPASQPIIIPFQFQPYYRLIITAELLTGLGVREPFLGHLRQLLIVPGIGEVKGRSLAVTPFQQMFIPSTELPYKLAYQPIQRDFSLKLTIQVESSIVSNGGSADNAPVLAAIQAVQTQLDNWTGNGEANDYTPLFTQVLSALAAVELEQSSITTQVASLVDGQSNSTTALETLQSSINGLSATVQDILALVASPVGHYESEAVTVLEAFTGNYSQTRKNAVNALIQGLKDDDLWSKLARLHLVGLTAQDTLRCWKTLTLATNVNAMAFVADRGFTGNGTDSYLDLNFNPSTANSSYTLNSASLGVWSRTDTNASLSRDMGGRTAFNNDEAVLILREGGNAFYALNSDANTPGNAVSDSAGFFCNSRTSENLTTLYRNGASIASSSLASAQMPNQSFFLGAVNNGGAPLGFTNRQYSCWFIGGGLNAQQQAVLYARLNAYLVAIGAN